MQVSATLLLELGVILTVLTVLGTAARRFALSPIPLYLVAGLALGEGGITPIPAAGEFVSTGATIGVVLLLLVLGLEFSIGEFASSLRRHLPSAWVDVVLNATPGAIGGWLLGLNGVGILALAGVTYISSSGVIARLLSDLRRLGNRETPAVLSILVLEDFAMAAYLPLLAVLATGGTWLQALLGMSVAVAALSIAFAASYRWGHHVGRLVAHPDNEQVLLRILGLTLIVAALAEFVHASAAVGAFLVGLTLTGESADRARMVLSPLARPLRGHLLPRDRRFGGSRRPGTDAARGTGAGGRHRGNEGANRTVRRAPRGCGQARSATCRHRADRARRIFARHHRVGRRVDRRSRSGGDPVRVHPRHRGTGVGPLHRRRATGAPGA